MARDTKKKNAAPLREEIDPKREALIQSVLLIEEAELRLARKRCLFDLEYLAEVVYPRKDPSNNPFWMRFGWPQRLIFQLDWAFKAKQSVEIPAGFTLGVGDGRRCLQEQLTEPKIVDLAKFTCLFIMQSRETLKSSIRRISAIHDMIWFPFIVGMPAASAWYGHRMDMTEEHSGVIRKVMTRTRFAKLFTDVVPGHRDDTKFGTKRKISMVNRPPGAPEPSLTFLGIDQTYEGGRWRVGHVDDIETFRDRDSPTERETTKKGLKDKEFERDTLVGRMIAQGTPWHPDGAWNWLEQQKDTLTIKMPALTGDHNAFVEYAMMSDGDQVLFLEEYNEKCKPVFPHLDLPTLVTRWNRTDKATFFSQMLLNPRGAGRLAFDVDAWLTCAAEDVPRGLSIDIFQDPAMKKPDNRFEGDYAAIGVVAWHPRLGKRYVVDGIYRNDMTEDIYWAALGDLIVKWRPRRVFIEEDRHRDLNHIWRQYALKNRVPCAYLQPLERAGKANKNARILGQSGDFQTGDIVLVEGLDITKALIDEGRDYDRITGPAKHDDALDMLAQCRDPAVGGSIFGDGFDDEEFGEKGISGMVKRNREETWDDELPGC